MVDITGEEEKRTLQMDSPGFLMCAMWGFVCFWFFFLERRLGTLM